MKKIFLMAFLMTFIFSQAQAGVYRFKVFESSINQDEPFEVTVETGKKIADIMRITIKEIENNIVLFDIKKEGLKIKKQGQSLEIVDTIENLTCLNSEEYNNSYGDAPLTQEHTYGLSLKLFLEKGKIASGSFEVNDNVDEEMAMWGDLELIK